MNHDFPRMQLLPPYVFSIVDQLKQKVIRQGHEIFDFGLGNPDLPTPTHIVEALRVAVLDPHTHRYTCAHGILPLRTALCQWYAKKFNVELNPETESIVTLGSKEGLAHLALATLSSRDVVLVPSPCYPVHHFGAVMADAEVKTIPLTEGENFLATLDATIQKMHTTPKMLFINFPSNPTTQCVDLDFFTEIIALARFHRFWVVQDLAYADLVFDGYSAPSILQVPQAKEIAVEAYTLSKSYNMAGWRVGFLSGNADLIGALKRIKSYIDYGLFAAVQKAAIVALDGPEACVQEACSIYQKRRDMLCTGLKDIGWKVNIPKATMFVWLKIPPAFAQGSLAFAQALLEKAHVAVSPGIGFGSEGDQYIRLSLTENEARILKALENIKQFAKEL